uniref:Titin n=1 Tax=Gopherus evgoodei TaxID=1825980 RepID=A0A8C5F1M7_9SAUR
MAEMKSTNISWKEEKKRVSVGSNAVSRLIKCREPVNPPSAPTVVKVTDTSKTSVSLEWTKPVFDGGMEIIGYIIEMCKADLGEWHKVNAETCIATKYTVTDLEAGEHYKFRVSAVNGAGKGESCEVPATIQATDRLSSPEIDIDANFKQTHIVRAGATIRLFIAFLGKPVPTATWSKADSDLSLRSDIHITDSFSTLTVENCNRNDAGKYVFTVENVSGSKSITFTVKVLDTPGPPGPITFKDVTRGSITLMWDAPVLDGGARIHHYIVEKREASRRTGQTKQLTFTVEGLLENNEYEFRVKAKNDAGYSEPREAFSSVIIKEPQIEPTADLSGITRQLITCKAGSTFTIDIPIIPPSPPTRPEVYSVSANAMAIRWEEPYHDGGSKITGYWIEKKERNTILWVKENNVPSFECNYKVTGLVEGLEYQFRVYALNAAGVSKASEASRPIVAQNPVGKCIF